MPAMAARPGPGSEPSQEVTRTEREQVVRQLITDGRLQAAATDALNLYGAEIFGFLHAVARDDDLAAEAFSSFGEDLWKGLPAFRWEASLRTWSYALARNALHRLRRDPRRRARNNVPLSDASSAVARIADQVRTATLPYLRTEIKDQVRALRDALDPDDHALLVLRVDRKLSWKDIARAMPGDDEADGERRAATLRKRFERAKAMLRELAVQRGIIPSS